VRLQLVAATSPHWPPVNRPNPARWWWGRHHTLSQPLARKPLAFGCMPSETTHVQSEHLGQRTFTALNQSALMLPRSARCLNGSLQGEQEHRTVKRIFPRTSKRGYAGQIARREHRTRILRTIRERNRRIKERGHPPQCTADSLPAVHNRLTNTTSSRGIKTACSNLLTGWPNPTETRHLR